MSNLHRRKRHATISSPAQARDWSSLAPDLVRCICGIFLSNGDIDYYVRLRGVCQTWRASTDDPCGPEPCFRPYGWAMLGSLDRDAAGEQDSRRLFLHTNTGRFMWKDMPMLHGDAADACIAADDTNGLLILMAAGAGIRVLNPFTGYMVSHPKSWDSLGHKTAVVAVHGKTRMELYTFWKDCLVVRKCQRLKHETSWNFTSFAAVRVTFQGGCAYEVDEKGLIGVVEVENGSEKVRPVFLPYRSEYHPYYSDFGPLHTFLVDNDGELLLVCHRKFMVHVFSVDLENKAVYAIRSIGGRAILVGNRCLSVDANNCPGIEGNCIYYIGGIYNSRGIYMFRLQDGSHEKLFESSPNEVRLAQSSH